MLVLAVLSSFFMLHRSGRTSVGFDLEKAKRYSLLKACFFFFLSRRAGPTYDQTSGAVAEWRQAFTELNRTVYPHGKIRSLMGAGCEVTEGRKPLKARQKSL